MSELSLGNRMMIEAGFLNSYFKHKENARNDEDLDWITVNGTHIPLKNGEAVGGPLKGSDFSKAKSTGKERAAISEKAKKIMEESKREGYIKFGKSTEEIRAIKRELKKELEDSGIKVEENHDEDEDSIFRYKVNSPKLSYEECVEATKSLNQSPFASNIDREDYIEECRKAGEEPRLHETPNEINANFFYTKSGKLQHDGTPVYDRLDKESLLSDKELIQYSGDDSVLNPQGKEELAEASRKAIDSMSNEEKSALNNYTRQFSGASYFEINEYYNTGEGSDKVKENAKLIDSALDNEIGKECIVCRGETGFHGSDIDDKINKLVNQISKGNFTNADKLKNMLEGKEFTNDSPMSTSPGNPLEGFSSRPVQMFIKTPANAKAVNITELSAYGGGRSEAEKKLAETGLFGNISYENEVLFKPKTKYKVERVEYKSDIRSKKKNGQIYVVCSIITDNKDSRTDEEPASWITLENGEHVPLNSSGQAIGGAGGWAAGRDFSKARSEKKESGSKGPGSFSLQKPSPEAVSDSMKPKYNDYDMSLDYDFQTFMSKNAGNKRRPTSLYNLYNETEENGGDGFQTLKDEFYKTRLADCSSDLKEISNDEADEILYDNLNPGTVQAWFREYNHEVKDGLVWQMTRNPETHNAALNVMYDNYKYFNENSGTTPLSYEEFLVTPIKMYRGGSGEEYDEAGAFSAYTFDKDVAKGFTVGPLGSSTKFDPNGVIYEAEIRPIDTYGSVFHNGEAEILVPRPIAPNGNRDSRKDNEESGKQDKLYSSWELDALFKIYGISSNTL